MAQGLPSSRAYDLEPDKTPRNTGSLPQRGTKTRMHAVMVSSSLFSVSFVVVFPGGVKPRCYRPLPQTFAGSIVVLDSCLCLQVKALGWSLGRVSSFPTSQVVTHSSSLIEQFVLRIGRWKELANDFLRYLMSVEVYGWYVEPACLLTMHCDSTPPNYFAAALAPPKPQVGNCENRNMIAPWYHHIRSPLRLIVSSNGLEKSLMLFAFLNWYSIRRYSGSAICHSTNLLPPDTEFVVHGLRSAFLDIQLETLPIVRYSRSNQIKSGEGTRDHFDPWLRNESETLKQIETDYWRQVLPLTVGIDQLVRRRRRRLCVPKLAYSGHLCSDCLLFPRVQVIPSRFWMVLVVKTCCCAPWTLKVLNGRQDALGSAGSQRSLPQGPTLPQVHESTTVSRDAWPGRTLLLTVIRCKYGTSMYKYFLNLCEKMTQFNYESMRWMRCYESFEATTHFPHSLCLDVQGRYTYHSHPSVSTCPHYQRNAVDTSCPNTYSYIAKRWRKLTATALSARERNETMPHLSPTCLTKSSCCVRYVDTASSSFTGAMTWPTKPRSDSAPKHFPSTPDLQLQCWIYFT